MVVVTYASETAKRLNVGVALEQNFSLPEARKAGRELAWKGYYVEIFFDDGELYKEISPEIED